MPVAPPAVAITFFLGEGHLRVAAAAMPETLLVPVAINATAFSPDGSYLVCGTSIGHLHVWHFPDGALEDDDGTPVPPSRVAAVLAHGCAVYALEFAETAAGLLLLSSADEEVRGWRWADVLAAGLGDGSGVSSGVKPVLRLENPRTALRRGGLGQLSETSALAADAVAAQLYTASGDGNAYCWDLATGQIVTTYTGVGEPLHCLALCAARRKQLITGGEDGWSSSLSVRGGRRYRKTLKMKNKQI